MCCSLLQVHCLLSQHQAPPQGGSQALSSGPTRPLHFHLFHCFPALNVPHSLHLQTVCSVYSVLSSIPF